MDILFFILLALLGLCCMILFRNEAVCNYKCQLADRSYKVCKSYLENIRDVGIDKEKSYYHTKLRDMWASISNISYDKMLLMFWKPLEDEYWLTKEQIDFLNLEF